MNLSFITFQHWDDILYSFWLYSNIKSTVWVLFSCLNDEFYHWSFCLVVFCFQIDVMRSISVSFDSVNLVFSDRQDSQFVTPVGRRQTTWSRTSPTQSNHTIEVWCRGEFSSLKPVSICKFAPTRKKKKPQHISLSARSLLLLNNQRLCNLLQPDLEIALCLNWIDECIVTAIVSVCPFLFFFPIYYVIER